MIGGDNHPGDDMPGAGSVSPKHFDVVIIETYEKNDATDTVWINRKIGEKKALSL